jgi:hypothetical protein
MATQLSTRFESIRNPEYTGENRCIPCTAANVVVAGGLALGVGVLNPLAGVGVLGASLAAIYLRGYLVPGTPELTKRAFDKDPRARRAFVPETFDPETFDAERILLDAGAIVADPDADDVTVDAEFEAAWFERMARLGDGETDVSELAEFVDVDPERLSLTYHSDAFVARIDGRRIGQWESRAAFVADVAAARELAARAPGWDALPLTYRSQVLGGLRICLERCPLCDGDVEIGQDVVQSCCRTYDVVAATCTGCDARLFEAEFDPAALAEFDGDQSPVEA